MLPAVPTGHIAERGPVIPASALTCAHCGDVIGVYEPLLLTGDGKVRVTIVYDHRLMDGGTIATFLAELEQIMQKEIVQELRSLPAATAPSV